MDTSYDVIVLGSGNAAMSAALAAEEGGANVLVVERAPEETRGGNSAYTAGGFRMVHKGIEDIRRAVPDLSEDEISKADFGSYSREDFLDYLGEVSQYFIDPDLAEVIVENSTDTIMWMQQKGIRFLPNYGRNARNINGRFKFWTGVVLAANGGGRGLMDNYFKAAEKKKIPILYNTQGIGLLRSGKGVGGVRVLMDGEEKELRSKAVVLACGGFEANREMRTRYLGPGWEGAKFRGTRYNTGDGIRMALDFGAQSYGQWSRCFSVAWDRYNPEPGDINHPHGGNRQCYALGVVVNSEGKRFVDEGAKPMKSLMEGRLVLEQPGGYAWQIFDAKAKPFLTDEYKLRGATKVVADTLEQLLDKIQDVHGTNCLETIKEYNAAVQTGIPFDPTKKDGRHTVGLAINKSNWANAIDTPPFEAYSVGCGITFTFGGIKIDTGAHVLDINDRPIPGLYATGELVGGLYYFNYPGSTGLMAAAVFGRLAGSDAAAFSKERKAA